mgnify:CR=1 FL=1
MNLFDVYPIQDITIVKAKGSYVWDDAGEQYLDLYGGHAVISIGHTHPHWVNRIEDQLHKIAFYSNSVVLPIQNELADLRVMAEERELTRQQNIRKAELEAEAEKLAKEAERRIPLTKQDMLPFETTAEEAKAEQMKGQKQKDLLKMLIL